MAEKSRLFLVVAIIMGVLAFGVSAQSAGEHDTVTVTGKFVMSSAIGGETTGFAVELEESLKIWDEEFAAVEVDFGGIKYNFYLYFGKRVEVTGKLARRCGVERGSYWVIESKGITMLD